MVDSNKIFLLYIIIKNLIKIKNKYKVHTLWEVTRIPIVSIEYVYTYTQIFKNINVY